MRKSFGAGGHSLAESPGDKRHRPEAGHWEHETRQELHTLPFVEERCQLQRLMYLAATHLPVNRF